MKKALLALPYVESVEVTRAFPNTLQIRLVEYEPVARVKVGEGPTYLVSDTGKVLEDDVEPIEVVSIHAPARGATKNK